LSSSLYQAGVEAIVRGAQQAIDRLRGELTRKGGELPRLYVTAEKRAAWKPHHDYLADWNAVCVARSGSGAGWKPLRALTPGRRKHLRARQAEKWDWPLVLEELAVVQQRWVAGFPGFGFDWLIRSTENWMKVAEGKYRDEGLRARQRAQDARSPGGDGGLAPLPIVSEPSSGAQARQVWRVVLAALEVEIDPHSFRIWLGATEGVGYDAGGALVVAVPSQVHCETIPELFTVQLEQAMNGEPVRMICHGDIRT